MIKVSCIGQTPILVRYFFIENLLPQRSTIQTAQISGVPCDGYQPLFILLTLTCNSNQTTNWISDLFKLISRLLLAAHEVHTQVSCRSGHFESILYILYSTERERERERERPVRLQISTTCIKLNGFHAP